MEVLLKGEWDWNKENGILGGVQYIVRLQELKYSPKQELKPQPIPDFV